MHKGLPIGKPTTRFGVIGKGKKMWKIPFMSFKTGEVLTLNVYGGSGEVVLKGAANPFITSEDESSDIFTALRTQSGNFSIVDDGKDGNGNAFDWTQMIPTYDTSHMVKLTAPDGNSTKVLWQGFMQTQDFGSTLFGGTQVRSFPVQCALSVLAVSDFEPSGSNGIKNFGWVIKQLFDVLTNTGIEVTKFCFQGNNAREWLRKQVDLENFVESGNYGGTVAKWDCQRVLMDICQFWGWTCRMHGTVVYFTNAYDSANTQYLELTPSQLGDLGENTGSYVNVGAKTITLDSALVNMNSETYYMHGYGKAYVSADGNEADADLIFTYPDVVEKQMEGGSYYTETYSPYTIVYSTDLLNFSTTFLTGQCGNSGASFNVSKIMKSGQSDVIHDVVRLKKSYGGGTYATFSTVWQHAFKGLGGHQFGRYANGLQLFGTAYVRGEKYENASSVTGVGQKSMYICLGIGTPSSMLWYDGMDWGSTKTAFKVTLGNSDDLMRVVYTSGGLTITTSVITFPTNYTLHGIVQVELLGSDDMPENDNVRAFDIANFRVATTNSAATAGVWGDRTQSSTKDYTAKASNMIQDEWGSDLVWASDNDMPRGYGVVMNTDYSPMGKLIYGNVEKYPEQYLADKVASYWSRSKGMMSIDIWNSDIVPTDRVGMTEIAGTWHAASISHKWWDEKETIILVQSW